MNFTTIGDLQENVVVKQVQKGLFKNFYKQKNFLNKEIVNVRKNYLCFFENPSRKNEEKNKSKENHLKFFKTYVRKSMNKNFLDEKKVSSKENYLKFLLNYFAQSDTLLKSMDTNFTCSSVLDPNGTPYMKKVFHNSGMISHTLYNNSFELVKDIKKCLVQIMACSICVLVLLNSDKFITFEFFNEAKTIHIELLSCLILAINDNWALISNILRCFKTTI